MEKVKVRYNEELFGKAIGQENVSCPIVCNMDEDNVEYYLNDDSYPTKISKDELKLKCIDNKISYSILSTLPSDISIENVEHKMYELLKWNAYDVKVSNVILNLDLLTNDEIVEELEYLINTFENIEYEDASLEIKLIEYSNDEEGNALYDEDGDPLKRTKSIQHSLPTLKQYRSKEQIVLDLLLNKLFYIAIK